jgi:TM2 domain-containing membrane protein YozV
MHTKKYKFHPNKNMKLIIIYIKGGILTISLDFNFYIWFNKDKEYVIKVYKFIFTIKNH